LVEERGAGNIVGNRKKKRKGKSQIFPVTGAITHSRASSDRKDQKKEKSGRLVGDEQAHIPFSRKGRKKRRRWKKAE